MIKQFSIITVGLLIASLSYGGGSGAVYRTAGVEQVQTGHSHGFISQGISNGLAFENIRTAIELKKYGIDQKLFESMIVEGSNTVANAYLGEGTNLRIDWDLEQIELEDNTQMGFDEVVTKALEIELTQAQ